MALFRDRRGFPRWSFIDSRSLPHPRRAKDDKAPDDEPTSASSAPQVPVSWETPDEETATSLESADSPASAESSVSSDSAGSASTGDTADDADTIAIPAVADEPSVHWLAERRAWFAESGDWPTEASDESVQLAATHPKSPYVAPDYPGLPAASPAEVRARHGRGFSTHRRRRRKRHHGHEAEKRRVDIDLAALDAALDATETHLGDGLVDLVVWHATTGLPLAARGVDPVTATLWHQATRDVRAMLPYADLPALGSYHLIGLADRRLAVLVHAGADLGACVTVDLAVVSVNDLMTTAIPQLHESLAAASREY
jgi:hypothetical protein